MSTAAGLSEPADLGRLAGVLGDLAPAPDTAGMIDQLAALEHLKAAAGAAQARVTESFRQARLVEEEAAGVPARHRGRGIGAEVALARRESPHRGSRLVGMATALVTEMPHTLAALAAGRTNEWRATVLVQQTACLTRADRAAVDAELAARLPQLGDREVEAEAKKIAYRLDPHTIVDHARRAESERRVSLRPAPDTMTYLTALLPLQQGVAAYAALTRNADQGRATGDERGRGQLMADTLVERITGQSTAGDVPVEIGLLIADTTLAGADDAPALLTGAGTTPTPVPAPWARDLVRDTDAQVWIRRLYTHGRRLVTIESTRRKFPSGLRRQIVLRDQRCRTPWCGAPIRHIDHVRPAATGGQTSEASGQGLCEACNYAKQAPRWRATPAGGAVTLTTPTGHTYTSRPPPLPAA